MAQYFTLPEAQALLPEVVTDLEAAVSLKQEAESIEEELRGVAARVQMMGGADLDPARFAASKARRRQVLENIQNKLQSIQARGVLVKDLDSGLLDFPALLNGEEVYLCWRLGEESIEWWHPVHAGFAGRQPISDPSAFGGPGTKRPN